MQVPRARFCVSGKQFYFFVSASLFPLIISLSTKIDLLCSCVKIQNSNFKFQNLDAFHTAVPHQYRSTRRIPPRLIVAARNLSRDNSRARVLEGPALPHQTHHDTRNPSRNPTEFWSCLVLPPLKRALYIRDLSVFRPRRLLLYTWATAAIVLS